MLQLDNSGANNDNYYKQLDLSSDDKETDTRKHGKLCRWKDIPVSLETLESIPGNDIVGTFRTYVNHENLGEVFRIKINGQKVKPVNVSTDNGDLRPLFKWLLQALNPEDGKADESVLDEHVETLFTPCRDPKGLDYFDSKAFKRKSRMIQSPKGRAKSLDMDPKITAIISPEEIAKVLTQSEAPLKDKKETLHKIVRKKAIRSHLQEIPHIRILSALSINAFAEADARIKEVFPEFSPMEKNPFQLKQDNKIPAQFSIQNDDGGFRATQRRTYTLLEYSNSGGENPWTVLGTVKVRWTLSSPTSEGCNGNLTLSKINFLENVDEQTMEAVERAFQKALNKQTISTLNLSSSITNLPSKSEMIDTAVFSDHMGKDMLESLYGYRLSRFNLAGYGQNKNYNQITFPRHSLIDFPEWFLEHILQSKAPKEELHILYGSQMNSKFRKEERYYGEQFYKKDINVKIVRNILQFHISDIDQNYLLTLKMLANDDAKCKKFVEAIKKCNSQSEVGKAVTKAVLMEYSTDNYNLGSDLEKFQVMAYAASAKFDTPFKKEFTSYRIESPRFRIERNRNFDRADEVNYILDTGNFEIRQTRVYSIKQKTNDSPLLNFAVISTISGKDKKYTGSHAIVDIEVCDKVYSPTAIEALQELKRTLENRA